MGCRYSCYRRNRRQRRDSIELRLRNILNDYGLRDILPENRPHDVPTHDRLDGTLHFGESRPVFDLTRRDTGAIDSHLSDSGTVSVATSTDISDDDNISISNSDISDKLDLLSFISFDREQTGDNVYIDDDNCIICVENFDDNDHRPVVLPCGHMLCLKCTAVLARKRAYGSIICPTDRLVHKVTNFKIRQMRNYSIEINNGENNELVERQTIGFDQQSVNSDETLSNTNYIDYNIFAMGRHYMSSMVAEAGLNSDIQVQTINFDKESDTLSNTSSMAATGGERDSESILSDRTITPDYSPFGSKSNSVIDVQIIY